jgi:hypothetical protein
VISLGRFVVAGTGMGSSRLGETETPTNLGTTKIKYRDDIFSDSRTERRALEATHKSPMAGRTVLQDEREIQ